MGVDLNYPRIPRECIQQVIILSTYDKRSTDRKTERNLFLFGTFNFLKYIAIPLWTI